MRPVKIHTPSIHTFFSFFFFFFAIHFFIDFWIQHLQQQHKHPQIFKKEKKQQKKLI